MITLKEFNNINEAFDIDNVTYQKNIAFNDILKNLPTVKGVVSNHMTYSFNIDGIDYLVFRYIKDGYMEFHFADMTNDSDFDENNIPINNPIKVFSTVLKITYDNKIKSKGKIRICFTKNRESLYTKIFKSVKNKYFDNFNMSTPYKYNTTKREGKEDLNLYAFNLIVNTHEGITEGMLYCISDVKKLLKGE
jgi:hypothetical protein